MLKNQPWNRLLVIPSLMICLSYCSNRVVHEKADLILFNGHIITVDPVRPQAEAVAINGDRILAVGKNKEMMQFKEQATRLLDLKGKTAIPGLIDAHMHLPELGKGLNLLYLDKTRNYEEVIEIVGRIAAKAKPGEWIMGSGWHTASWGTVEYPTHEALSKVTPQNPVYLDGMATHAVLINQKAMELAGITKDTPSPHGGVIFRDPRTGSPTGILLERAKELVTKIFPPETHRSLKKSIQQGIAAAVSLGLTGIHDAGVDQNVIQVYKELLRENSLNIRLYVMPFVTGDGKLLDETISRPPEIGLGKNLLTIRCIKAFIDGALGARGASLLEPYSDSPKDAGLLINSEENIHSLLVKCLKAGYQVSLHAIGDRANRIALDSIEKAQEETSAKNPRCRIEHAQILTARDLPRFSRLGVIPSMQPVQCPMDIGFAEARVGRERLKGAYAWRSLLDSGARIAGGSDVPAYPLEYSNPLWGIYSAFTRKNTEGKPEGGWHPEQSVTRMEALRMFTIDAAYAAFEENLKGSLTPRKLADIVVLSHDILSVPESDVLKTEVEMTILGGRVIFQK